MLYAYIAVAICCWQDAKMQWLRGQGDGTPGPTWDGSFAFQPFEGQRTSRNAVPKSAKTTVVDNERESRRFRLKAGARKFTRAMSLNSSTDNIHIKSIIQGPEGSQSTRNLLGSQ